MSLEKRPDGTAVLRMDGEFSIYRASELKPVLLDAVEECPVLDVDLSNVTELDSAGLQLLLLGRRLAEARQHGFRVTNPSPAVSEVLTLLDLTAYFDGSFSSSDMHESMQ